MPDPQMTREWSVSEEGGPDEQKREEVNIVPQQNRETRTYTPSVEGGPDELARAKDEKFTQAALAHQVEVLKKEAAGEQEEQEEQEEEETQEEEAKGEMYFNQACVISPSSSIQPRSGWVRSFSFHVSAKFLFCQIKLAWWGLRSSNQHTCQYKVERGSTRTDG